MNSEKTFLLSPTSVYLADGQGRRRSLTEASQLLMRDDGRIAVMTTESDHCLQPMGFPSAHRGAPWVLNTPIEMGLPMITTVVVVRATLEILGLCGIRIIDEYTEIPSEIARKAVFLAKNNAYIRLKVMYNPGQGIGDGAQVSFSRTGKTFGDLHCFYPRQETANNLEWTRIESPLAEHSDEVQWMKWQMQVREVFALGGIFLRPLCDGYWDGAYFVAEKLPVESELLRCENV
jgi:hypothetical protein